MERTIGDHMVTCQAILGVAGQPGFVNRLRREKDVVGDDPDYDACESSKEFVSLDPLDALPRCPEQVPPDEQDRVPGADRYPRIHGSHVRLRLRGVCPIVPTGGERSPSVG
jgi:hypothetical protein